MDPINLLRLSVTVDRSATFAVLTPHEHPERRSPLESGEDEELERFVQKVRRFYPFCPFIGGRVLTAFDRRRHHFAPETRVFFDLYGTNRDPRIWENSGASRPQRFREWDGSAFTCVPQGGGDPATGRRGPGNGSRSS